MAKRSRSKTSKSRGPVRYARNKYSAYMQRSAYSAAGSNRIVGLPAGMRIKMKYTDQINLSSGVVGYVEHIFRAFSIFDPDLTGVGHQPLGHDEMSALYERYRVLGSTARVDFVVPEAPETHSLPTTCVLNLVETASALNSTDLMVEMPISRWKTSVVSANPTTTLRLGYTSTWQMKGDAGAATDGDYSAAFGSNPTIDAYYHIAAGQDGNSSVDCYARIEIVYDVWCFDPVTLSTS